MLLELLRKYHICIVDESFDVWFFKASTKSAQVRVFFSFGNLMHDRLHRADSRWSRT